MPVDLTPLSLAAVLHGVGSRPPIADRLGLPDLTNDGTLLQHGVRELLVRGLVEQDGDDVRLDPDLLPVGPTVADATCVISLLVGTAEAGTSFLLDGPGPCVALDLLPHDLVRATVLPPADDPTERVVSAVHRVLADGAPLLLGMSPSGVASEERVLAIRRAAGENVEVRRSTAAGFEAFGTAPASELTDLIGREISAAMGSPELGT